MMRKCTPFWVVEFPVPLRPDGCTISKWSPEGKVLAEEIKQWVRDNLDGEPEAWEVWDPCQCAAPHGHWGAGFDIEENAFHFNLAWG